MIAASDPSCTACSLHSTCKTVCIPAVWYGGGKNWPRKSGDGHHDRALYIIGESPGWNEDQKGVPWIGQAGKILKALYIDYFKLSDQVDIFLSNAIRCHPPGNKNPTQTQLKMCQGFYLADIVHLQKIYDQVIVLCCGAPATQSVLGLSLKKSFSRQSDFTDFRALTSPTPKSIIRLGEVVGPYLDDPILPPFPSPCAVFTTYHPAAVGRDKNKGPFVAAHIKMLVAYLKGELTYEITAGSLHIHQAPRPPTYPLPWLSLDIETYGILKGQTQTMWHPLKSMKYDHIPRNKLVVTTGITWQNEQGELEHGIFIMSRERHRRRLWSWLRKCLEASKPSGMHFTTPSGGSKTSLTYLRDQVGNGKWKRKSSQNGNDGSKTESPGTGNSETQKITTGPQTMKTTTKGLSFEYLTNQNPQRNSETASTLNGNTTPKPTVIPPLDVNATSSGTFEYLIGQNIKFDLLYLRHAYTECKIWLNHPLPIADLIVTNYLYNEGRPERSLKALAPLLRVTRYKEGFTQYATSTDTTLHQYNCQDTAATILSHQRLESLIRTLYGSTSPKLSNFNREWYSQILWMTVWMEERGIAMDETALKGLMKSYEARLQKLEKGIQTRWKINLRGKGSETHKRAVMDQACHTLLTSNMNIPSLDKTPVRREISYSESNRNALLDVLPATTPSAQKLRAISSVHTVTGVLDRYLYPLLVGRGSSHADPTTLIIGGITYPRIYPVPSDFEDGAGGGTKQCRIVFKGPAVQTFPPKIKACITSRYDHLLWFDYSQLELRIAALMSNDPWMMEEYSKPDCDFHLGTARKLFGDANAKKFRQIGKTLNFLVIYLGGADQYQRTLLRDEAIVRSRGQCQQDIDAWWALAKGLHKWQEELYQFVCEHGWFQLPLAGQSRLYLGNRSDVRDQMKEIVNMPVQAVAANIMLSAQFELQWSFMRKRMKAILPLNVYDSATIEFPTSELHTVKREMDRILPNPPYYQELCHLLGRSLPLKYDTKIVRVAA